jgi:hypothetical protein
LDGKYGLELCRRSCEGVGLRPIDPSAFKTRPDYLKRVAVTENPVGAPSPVSTCRVPAAVGLAVEDTAGGGRHQPGLPLHRLPRYLMVLQNHAPARMQLGES